MYNIGNDREDIVEGVLAVNKKRDMQKGHDEDSGEPEEDVFVMEEGREEDRPTKSHGVEEDT